MDVADDMKEPAEHDRLVALAGVRVRSILRASRIV